MHRAYHRWFSSALHRDMELLAFGHGGPPLLVFPTADGAFFEYEDRGMVAALAPRIEGGQLRLFTLSTVNRESWLAADVAPRRRVLRHLQYEDCLLTDVIPFVRQVTGAETVGATGCGFGGYHAMVLALRHPSLVTSCITMGATFDIAPLLDGYFDEDCYLLNPPSFLPGLTDAYYLDAYRRNTWVLATGEGEARPATEQFAWLMGTKGIGHALHVLTDAANDWPGWAKMAGACLP